MEEKELRRKHGNGANLIITKVTPEQFDAIRAADEKRWAEDEKRWAEEVEDEHVHDERFESMATNIFEQIERIKGKFSNFDWHGDGRDRKFFAFKVAMDGIWEQIQKYRGQCWEAEMEPEAEKLADEMLWPF